MSDKAHKDEFHLTVAKACLKTFKQVGFALGLQKHTNEMLDAGEDRDFSGEDDDEKKEAAGKTNGAAAEAAGKKREASGAEEA